MWRAARTSDQLRICRFDRVIAFVASSREDKGSHSVWFGSDERMSTGGSGMMSLSSQIVASASPLIS